MLDKLTKEFFQEHLNTPFRIRFGALDEGQTLELVLADIDVYGPNPTSAPRPEPFSLIFIGPRDRVLPQRIYPLEHDQLGMLEIFIVPIGPDQRGMRYEAVFN